MNVILYLIASFFALQLIVYFVAGTWDIVRYFTRPPDKPNKSKPPTYKPPN